MKFTSCFILFFSACLSLSCVKEPNKLVVGFFGSLTGEEATFGLSARDGIELAIEEVNARGGVLGKPVELKIYDTQGTDEGALTSVKRLITLDHVVALLGEVSSSRSLVSSLVAQKHQIPMITPSATNPLVTQTGDYIFRVCFIDPFQGEVMAKFAYKSLKLKKAAILNDSQSSYSTGLAEYFKETFQSLGGEVVIEETYVSGDVVFENQLSRIKKKGAEFIFLPAYYAEAALVAKEIQKNEMKIPLLGGDGWESESLLEIAGDSLNGSYFSSHYTLEDPNPEVQDFIKTYQKKFGTKPDSQAALAYDAARILFEAIKRAKSTKGNSIRDALNFTSNFRGITGSISFNENRDAVKPAVVLQIKGDKVKFVESIGP